MEIHVGDIVKVKSGNGNGVSPTQNYCEVLSYSEFTEKPFVSGILKYDNQEEQFIIKFTDERENIQYRRIYRSHIIEIVESVHSNIKYTTEDYNYLIPLLTELNTT